MSEPERIDHPHHYGGADNPYEAINVIEAWELGFHLGNVLKYLSRYNKQGLDEILPNLRKARWYLDRYIQMCEGQGDDDAEAHPTPETDAGLSRVSHQGSEDLSAPRVPAQERDAPVSEMPEAWGVGCVLCGKAPHDDSCLVRTPLSPMRGKNQPTKRSLERWRKGYVG